jgi:hypothetical protein
MLAVKEEFLKSEARINKSRLPKDLKEKYGTKVRPVIPLKEATQPEMELLKALGNDYIVEKKASK